MVQALRHGMASSVASQGLDDGAPPPLCIQEARAMVQALRHGMASSVASQGLGLARGFMSPGRLLYFEKVKAPLHPEVRVMTAWYSLALLRSSMHLLEIRCLENIKAPMCVLRACGALIGEVR